MELSAIVEPTFDHLLDGLASQLRKAAEGNRDPDAILSARLAPDMYPLSRQIEICCTQALWVIDRLLGKDLSPGRPITSFAEAYAEIDRARAHLREGAKQLDSVPLDREIRVTVTEELVLGFTAPTFVIDWALPQMYFHALAAYSIMRHCGVPLGKFDYVAHLLAYRVSG